jgi:hypothetical protein
MEDFRRTIDGKAVWPNLHICIEAACSITTSRSAAAVLICLQSLMYARGRVFWGIAVRSLLAVAFAALTSITAAFAQTTNVPDTAPPSAFGPDPILQITTTFQARIEGLADPREVPTRTAQDTARRTLYNMAADECTLLAQFWKAECRLSSFTVYLGLASIAGPDAQPQVPSMIGTAVYEIRLTSPGR